MNKIEFKNLPDMTTPLSAENLNQLQDNMEDAIVPIKLVSVGTTAPATATIGDMYYNTTDNKIYTAIAENTWDSGSEPRYDGFYIDINNHNTYYYNGTSLIISSNEILTSLSDIGITITDDTTLDAIVTAVPKGKTLRLYLSNDNASTLYGTSGGAGNLPTNIAGILTVQKNSENNWVYISYKTNLLVFEDDKAGIFYTSKFTVYRDWVKLNEVYVLQKDVFTGRYWFDGKPIYRSVIYIPTLTINKETQIRITNKSIRDLISFNGSFRYEDDFRVPWNFYNTYNTQRSHCYSWVQGYNFLYSTNLEGCVDGYVIIEFTSY